MLSQLFSTAFLTNSFGDRLYPGNSSGNALAISQFWQCLQLRLQPTVPIDKDIEPGRKWYNGFFSIGSIATDTGLL